MAILSAVMGFRKKVMRTLLVFILLLFSLSLSGYEANATVAAGSAGQPVIGTGDVVPGIAKQIEERGRADVLVMVDNGAARDFAGQQRKAMGLKYNNRAIIAGMVPIVKQEKEKVLSRLSGPDYQVKANYEHFPVLFLSVNSHALNQLRHMKDVKAVSKNLALRPFTTNCTGGVCTDNQTLIGIPDAWNYGSGQTGTGTAVAVLDTGVDLSGSYFGTCTGGAGSPGCSVVYEQCFGTGGTGGTGGTPSCYSDNSHGTNVQGTVLQVAPDTQLVSLDVFSTSGYAYDSDILTALNWVINNYVSYNIVSVNMSLGAGGYSSPCPNDPLASAVSTLRNDGVATAVASGNQGWATLISSPACVPGAISVGAVYVSDYGSLTWCADPSCASILCTDTTTQADQVTCFSNSASFLSLLAPGSEITAAGITMSGTSQATPHVAGSVAVLKSEDSSLSVDEEEARLQVTGHPDSDYKVSSTNPRITPRVDLYAAVSVSKAILVAGPTSFDFTAPATVNPASQTLKIINGGTYTMNWTLTSDSAWLIPASTSGTGSADVSVGVNTLGLSAGTYTGQLTVTATYNPGTGTTTATNSPITIPVTLNVLNTAYEEDFETGNLSKLPWVTGGNGSWYVENSTVFDGTYAAQSPSMTDSQSSYLQVTLNVTSPGYVYFWLKTDTEPTYDNLMFSVDGVNEGPFYGWSGSNDWTSAKSEHEVTTGVHTFRWVYSKDSSVSDGQDAVWLDDIFFPPFNEVSVSPETYDFGAVPLGQSASETFTVTNLSAGSITLGSVSLGGTNASEFGITSDGCSSHTLTTNGTCTVGVTFTPSTLALGKTATLSIPVVGSTTTTASLSGIGGHMYTLTIDKSSSTGTGSVGSSPSGVDCGSVCSAQFLEGTQITLTPTADTGCFFDSWSGEGCSTGNCVFTITGDTTVSATFKTTPPVAGFSGSPLSGPAPLTVDFTDASLDNPTAWAWKFGDGGELYGGQGPEINPVYTYDNPGTYTVTLTVSNSGGADTLTRTDYVNVLCPVQVASQPSLDLCPTVNGAATSDGSVQAAFDAAASSGDTVEITDGAVISDNPVLSGGKTLTLRGGYDSSFTTSSGSSTINGSLTVGDGTLTVDSIIIK